MPHVLSRLLGILIFVGTAPLASQAAELVYVHEAGCPYCRIWDQKIGPVYDKTPEGQRAPLRRIEKHDQALAEMSLAKPVRYTPTFILRESGIEIGRIEGYPGEDFFWSRLAGLLQKLPVAKTAPERSSNTVGSSPPGGPRPAE